MLFILAYILVYTKAKKCFKFKCQCLKQPSPLNYLGDLAAFYKSKAYIHHHVTAGTLELQLHGSAQISTQD